MFSFIVTMIIIISVINYIKSQSSDPKNQQRRNEWSQRYDQGRAESQRNAQNSGQGNAQSGNAKSSAGNNAGNASRNAGPGTQHRAQNVRRYNIPIEPIRRANIVNGFSHKHALNLTDHQVYSIVNASYLSEGWAGEIESMTHDYPIRSMWMQGPTAWLRAYLHAFVVQDITSDIIQQGMIAETAFEEVMKYSDTLEGVTMTERIDLVNAKFMTQFDDISFMTAFRFLQSRGFKHTLDHARPGSVDDAEELGKKYMNDDTANDENRKDSEDPGLRPMAGH